MRLRIGILLLSSFFFMTAMVHESHAQETFWGVQLSPGFSTQKWNTSSRGSLFTISGDVFMSASGTNPDNMVYGKIGYHQRGSANKFVNFNQFNGSIKYLFHNVVVGAGIQKYLNESLNVPFYYLLGARLEYTGGTNLKSYDSESIYYPKEGYVNRFNYGVDFGGGYIFNFLPDYDFFMEAMISPDYSLQYEQDPLFNVTNPYYPSQTIDIAKRYVRNLSFEISLGLRMAR